MNSTEEPRLDKEPDVPGDDDRSQGGQPKGESIPIEPAIGDFSPPKPYSIRVHITANQQASTRLLSQLVSEEGKSQRSPRISRPRGKRWLYAGIALILILAITWPLVFRSPSNANPIVNPSVSEFNRYLQSIPTNAPVLVGIEYEAAFSGELDSAAIAVMSQLLTRRIFFVLVSTTPTGVLQGERIIATLEKQMSYVLESPTHYVNLGYLPGGVVALNSIANSLQTTLPVDITGNRAWENSALSGINSVNDFSSVIVLTHSTETGRTWIEQIAPHLDQTPLLMISSEQGAPVLRPYYEARPNQVQGLLVGLNGAASFETLSGLTDNARTQWNAYTIAVLAAALIVLAGGLVAAIAAASRTNPGETR